VSGDQPHIDYGSRILSQRFAEAGIRHRYEEFDDDHSDIDYWRNPGSEPL
jgi:enterochelin esterase-like enzyme